MVLRDCAGLGREEIVGLVQRLRDELSQGAITCKSGGVTHTPQALCIDVFREDELVESFNL
jgi:hypothetical protein